MKNIFIPFIIIAAFAGGCSKTDGPNSNTGTDTVTVIESFKFNSLNPVVDAHVGCCSDTIITFTLPPGTDPTSLAPTIQLYGSGSVSPTSGTAKDFSQDVPYTVTSNKGVVTKKYIARATMSSTPQATKVPKALCICYCWPSAVNGSGGNITNAVNVFKDFDIIVFGDGLSSSSHSDHLNTIQIIAGLKAIKPSIKIYGYIDLSTTIQNLSIDQIKTAVDNWKAMGVTGIFGDDMGSDYGVSRSRQNSVIDYVHSKSLSMFANAWSIEEVLGDNGGATHLGASDYYLMESALVGDDVITPLSQFKAKADRAYYYMRTLGVGICVSNTVAHDMATPTLNSSSKFKLAWCGAAMYNFDAFQFTDFWHSASSSQVYYYPNLSTSYGSSWLKDWITSESSTSLSRSSDTKTIRITINGTTASGQITP